MNVRDNEISDEISKFCVYLLKNRLNVISTILRTESKTYLFSL